MLPLIERAVLQRLGAVAVVAVLCLGAMMGFPKPAEARVWVGVNFGYPGYYYAPSYYYPAYYPSYGYGYYPRHRYWRHHYRRAHYRHHRNWCYRHPYRCSW